MLWGHIHLRVRSAWLRSESRSKADMPGTLRNLQGVSFRMRDVSLCNTLVFPDPAMLCFRHAPVIFGNPGIQDGNTGRAGKETTAIQA